MPRKISIHDRRLVSVSAGAADDAVANVDCCEPPERESRREEHETDTTEGRSIDAQVSPKPERMRSARACTASFESAPLAMMRSVVPWGAANSIICIGSLPLTCSVPSPLSTLMSASNVTARSTNRMTGRACKPCRLGMSRAMHAVGSWSLNSGVSPGRTRGLDPPEGDDLLEKPIPVPRRLRVSIPSSPPSFAPDAGSGGNCHAASGGISAPWRRGASPPRPRD